jgi:hypothetical protein
MLAVGSPLTSAHAALNAFTPTQVQPASVPADRPSGNALTGVSRLSLSSAASDALLRFGSLSVGARAASAPARVDVDAAPASTPSSSSDTGIPAARLAWLDSLGADRWELRTPAAIDDAEFEQQVLESLYKAGSAKLAGFTEARANGTLNIRRAADMPELGYKSFQVTLYKNGEAYGGVGFSVCNTDHWMALRESGIYAGTGTVAGNDYVATWPMAWGSGDDEPGIYAAA